MEEELKDTQPAAAPVQDNPTPAEAQPPRQDEPLPQEEDTEAATPATPERPESAITLQSVMKLIAEAEERGYERGRKAGADEERENARKCGTGSIWEDTRLAEADAEQRSRLKIDDEFLTRLRPTAWD